MNHVSFAIAAIAHSWAISSSTLLAQPDTSDRAGTVTSVKELEHLQVQLKALIPKLHRAVVSVDDASGVLISKEGVILSQAHVSPLKDKNRRRMRDYPPRRDTCEGLVGLVPSVRPDEMIFGENAGFLRPKPPLARHMGMAMAIGNTTLIFEHLNGT